MPFSISPKFAGTHTMTFPLVAELSDKDNEAIDAVFKSKNQAAIDKFATQLVPLLAKHTDENSVDYLISVREVQENDKKQLVYNQKTHGQELNMSLEVSSSREGRKTPGVINLVVTGTEAWVKRIDTFFKEQLDVLIKQFPTNTAQYSFKPEASKPEQLAAPKA